MEEGVSSVTADVSNKDAQHKSVKKEKKKKTSDSRNNRIFSLTPLDLLAFIASVSRVAVQGWSQQMRLSAGV